MITPEDIKYQLMATLPRYTTEFGESISANAAVVSSGAIKVTVTNHGLNSGDVIVGSDIKVIIPITSVVYDSVTKKATITTAFDQDRTSGLGDNGGYNVASLQDFADDDYNGDFTIRSATNDTMVISANADVTGALGNMIEDRSPLLGYLTITKIDANTFTVPLADTAIPNAAVFNTFMYTSSQRIFIAADAVRAVTAYAQHRNQEPALFIVFGTETASKDRNTINDAVVTATAQNPLHITYIPEVTLITLASTKTEHLASIKQQEIYETIRPALRKAMYGHIFEDTDTVQVFAAVEISNAPDRWNTGYYVHNFVYSIPYRISIEQGDVVRRNVSLRNIVVNSSMFDTEGALVVADMEITI